MDEWTLELKRRKSERMKIWRQKNREHILQYNKDYRENLTGEKKARSDELRRARKKRADKTLQGKIRKREQNRKSRIRKMQAKTLIELANFDPRDAKPVKQRKPYQPPLTPEERLARQRERTYRKYWADPEAARERVRLKRLRRGYH